jgi:hypoxanthine phosphoribosyltransferase
MTGEDRSHILTLKMSWENFEDYAKMLAEKIEKSRIKISNIYGEPRGGLVLAVRLSHLLNKPLILDWQEHNDYTLIVDDCVDSGGTLASRACSRIWKIAVLFWNPNASFEPKFYVSPKHPDVWIEFPWEKL